MSDLVFVCESPSYGGTILAIWGNGTHIYAGGGTTYRVRKYNIDDLTYIAQTPSTYRSIQDICGDDTYIYYTDNYSYSIHKRQKSDLALIASSPSYGGDIYQIRCDDTHVYAGGYCSGGIKLKKYLKSNMTFVSESSSLPVIIYSFEMDDDYLYVGQGAGPYPVVYKLLKSDLSYVCDSGDSGGYIWEVYGDDSQIYIGHGGTSILIYRKSDLLYLGESDYNPGGTTEGMTDDVNYVYGGGYYEKIVKLTKPNLSYAGQSPSCGGNIYSLWGNNQYVFAGVGYPIYKVRKYSKVGYRTRAFIM